MLITMPLKVVVVKGVVVRVHGVTVHLQSVVVQIQTGFRMLKPHPGLIIIGTNVVLMRVNIRVAAVVVVHTITPVVVDTEVPVWSRLSLVKVQKMPLPKCTTIRKR